MTTIASRRSNWHRWAWFGAQIAPNLPHEIGPHTGHSLSYASVVFRRPRDTALDHDGARLTVQLIHLADAPAERTPS